MIFQGFVSHLFFLFMSFMILDFIFFLIDLNFFSWIFHHFLVISFIKFGFISELIINLLGLYLVIYFIIEKKN